MPRLVSLALLVGLSSALLFVGSAVGSAFPDGAGPADVFGFEGLEPVSTEALPPLQPYVARDGTPLVMRVYPSEADRVVVFVHGSSYHGAAYHELASHLQESGVATVVVPNLRGHHLSGPRRGDVDYLGQLEDDVADLIGLLRERGHRGEVVLAGHSSGGGFAIRFAGGPHGALVDRVAVLAPMIPSAPAIRDGDAGGWARVNGSRYLGLTLLNALGVTGLNDLPVVTFAKPPSQWDGTETLAYSYRLNESYHPRYRYADDLAALPDGSLVLVGEGDQAIDAGALATIVADASPGTSVNVLDGVDHFGVFTDADVFERLVQWLRR
jgi:pimeloyl-ACP methyl ester carboxylesterase